MISGIKGKIFTKELSHCDVETAGGVIYRINISLSCYSAILDDEVTFLTTAIYREDSQTLFGFLDPNEQKMFEMLLKVNGVGPKVAMAICSTFSPSAFAEVVANQDLKTITKVPGIGNKSGGLILVQLGEFSSQLVATDSSPKTQAVYEATMALETLGFKKEMINKVLGTCSGTTVEDLVKEALAKFQK
ncbi:MAG: Holliday junction branch migration protein RuvA [Campylobacterales bacterium]|nr:Holliday junction branch migration protein RuvA [Campylobacterales bacterium]